MKTQHANARRIILAVLLLHCTAAFAETKNGFDLDQGLVPPGQIHRGGPAKDGIPSIDNPAFVGASDAGFLGNDARIIGIEINGTTKAYPIGILNWHEVVNDSINGTHYTITYCPLCGTGIAFNRIVNGEKLDFGVSGLLYNSDVLLYDRKTESLWSQIMGKAITGKLKGTELTMLPVTHTTWSEWRRSYPSTLVLSEDTGYSREYDKNPYAGYQNSHQLFFPVAHKAPERYHPKEQVLGVAIGGSYLAYPFIELNRYNKSSFTDRHNGINYVIHWNKEHQSGYITDDKGQRLPVIQSYWFAWYAFHPDTLTFIAPKTGQQ